MKAASLVLKTANGIEAIGAEKVDGLIETAKAISKSGTFKLRGENVAVSDGVVITSWSAFPAYRFRVRDDVQPAPVMTAGDKPRKIGK